MVEYWVMVPNAQCTADTNRGAKLCACYSLVGAHTRAYSADTVIKHGEIGQVFTVHKFMSTGEAYDACQCDNSIKRGDVLAIEAEGVIAIADTWPVAITSAHGQLHQTRNGSRAGVAEYMGDNGRSYDAACVVARELGFGIR